MFVWNHFTNDARVLRECTSLSDKGYQVDLICIHDPSDKDLLMQEKRNANFNIFRVRRYPIMLDLIMGILRRTKRNPWLLLPILVIWGTFLYFFPIVTISISILFVILFKMGIGPWLIKMNIFFRMVGRGLSTKYDIYHSNDLNTLIQGYILAKWRWRKKKLVYDSHEVQTSRTGYDSKIYSVIEGFLVKKVDSMIVENHTRAKYNEKLYSFYPSVVHNYPFKEIGESNDFISIHSLLNLPRDEKILLYQGGIQVGRGLDKLIKAAPLFDEGTLVFIGDGRLKPELIEMTNKMGLNHKVKFIPKVPLRELPKYTKNAYLGFQVLNNVCFNHWSASSNKLFEYIMNGIPVVACSFPEIKKVVEEEQIGICVDSHDYKAIANAVNLLLRDENLRNKFSDNCLIAKDKYNWENEEKALLEVYYQLS